MTLRPCSLGTDIPPPPTRPIPDRTPQITSQPSGRIDVVPVDQRLEVQVAARRQSGRAGVGDELPAADVTARHDAGEVVVRRCQVAAVYVAVVDHDAIAV